MDGTSHSPTANTNNPANSTTPALRRTGADKKTVSTRPFPRLTIIGAFLGAAALLLVGPSVAFAQLNESNHNANLSALTISPGTLTFDADTTSYTVEVDWDVDAVTVTPTTEDDNATVTVNGTAVAKGASSSIALSEDQHGSVTSITVQVTAEDRSTTKTYTITVLRAGRNAPRLFFRQKIGDEYKWFNRTYDSLDQLGCIGGDPGEQGCPPGNEFYAYTAAVESDKVQVMFTPDAKYGAASYSHETLEEESVSYTEANFTAKSNPESTEPFVNGMTTPLIDLTPGKATNIWVTVSSSSDDHFATQITTCFVPGGLSGLTLSSGRLTPTFDAGTTSYTVAVGNNVESVTMTPTYVASCGATITVDGTAVKSGSASGDIDLTAGDETSIDVVFVNGSSTETYTIAVTRDAPSVSFDAAAYEADEGGDVATITVTLSQPAAAMLEIPVTVTAGTAEADDYTVGGLVDIDVEGVTVKGLRFGIGAQKKTFTITALDEDDTNEDFDDETVTLSFGAMLPPGVSRGDPATATLTIIDDEGAVVPSRFRRLNNEILSKHALTLADVTIAAVTSRQEAGPTCADQATTGSLGGSSSLAEILRANAQTLTTGSLNLKQLLGTSSFRLRLTEDGSGAGPGCLTLWGQGDYRNLSSSDAQGLEWDGDLVTGQVGADALLQPDLRAGLAVSWSEGDFDYTDRTTGEPFSGDYTSRMMSVHPYLTWWSPAGLDVWATGGYGQGEIEIKDEEAGTHTSDTTLRLASVGASGLLPIGDALIAGGTTTLRVKAQASVAQMKVEGNGSLLEEQTIEAQRLRLALEGSHERMLASGGSLTPSLEVGLRHDGGDGATGTGLELGGGLRYVAPALGLTVEGRGRVLAAYEEDYEEWGASGLIRLDPGIDRQGLSLSLVPSYGQTASGVQRLWDQGLTQGSPQGAPTTQAPTGRLEAEVGYGLVAFAGQGLVTPYSAVTLGGGTQQYRVGSRVELGPELRLSLEGTRQVTTVGQADQGIRLQADWRF